MWLGEEMKRLIGSQVVGEGGGDDLEPDKMMSPRRMNSEIIESGKNTFNRSSKGRYSS